MCSVCGGMEVHVSNIPENFDKSQLLEYFNGQEHGGSYITDIAYPLRNNEAVLLYKHHKGVQLLTQSNHQLENAQLTLKVLPKPVFVSMTATLDPDITNLLLRNEKYIRELTSIPKVRFGIDKRTSLYGLEGTWYSLECAKVLLEKMQESGSECESPKKSSKDNLNENMDPQKENLSSNSPFHQLNDSKLKDTNMTTKATTTTTTTTTTVPTSSCAVADGTSDKHKTESGGYSGIDFDSPRHRRAYMKLARERFLSTFYQPDKSTVVYDEYHYPDSQWELYKKEGRMRNWSTRSNRDDSLDRDKKISDQAGDSLLKPDGCDAAKPQCHDLNHLDKVQGHWLKEADLRDSSPCHIRKSSFYWEDVRKSINVKGDSEYEKGADGVAPSSCQQADYHCSGENCLGTNCEESSRRTSPTPRSKECQGVGGNQCKNSQDKDYGAVNTRECHKHLEKTKESCTRNKCNRCHSRDRICDERDLEKSCISSSRAKSRRTHRGSVSHRNSSRSSSFSPNRDRSESCQSQNLHYRGLSEASDRTHESPARRRSTHWTEIKASTEKRGSIGDNQQDRLDPAWASVEKTPSRCRNNSVDGSSDNSPSPHRGTCRERGSSETRSHKSSKHESLDPNTPGSYRRGSSNFDNVDTSLPSPRQCGNSVLDSADSNHCPSLHKTHQSSREAKGGKRSPLVRQRRSSYDDSVETNCSPSRQDDQCEVKSWRDRHRHSSHEDTGVSEKGYQQHSSEEQTEDVNSPVHPPRGRRRKPKRQNPPSKTKSPTDKMSDCSNTTQCKQKTDDSASECKSKSAIPRCVGFRDKDLQFLANFSLHFQGGISVVVLCESITHIDTTAIVSPANQLLQSTGGIAQAISHAAGPDFDKMCREISLKNGLLDVSNIVCTRAGGLLRANYVIHVSAPFFNDYADIKQCHSALVHSYINCINYANGKLKARSIAFPPISTGELLGLTKSSSQPLQGSFGVDFDLSINAFYDALLIYTSDENTPKLLKDIRLVINDRDSVTFAIIILNQLNSMDSKEITEAALERYKFSCRKQSQRHCSQQTKKAANVSAEPKTSDAKVKKQLVAKESQLEPPAPSEVNKPIGLGSPRRSPSYTQAMCQLENGCMTKNNDAQTNCEQKANSLNFRKKADCKIDEESPDGVTSCLSALIHQTKTTLGAIRETNLDRKRSSSVGSVVRNRIQSSVVGGSDMDVRVGARLARSTSCHLEKDEKNAANATNNTNGSNNVNSNCEDGGKGCSSKETKGSKASCSSATSTPSKGHQATSVKQALLSTSQKVHSKDSSKPRSGFQPPKNMESTSEKESKSSSHRGEKNKKDTDKSKKDGDYDMRATNHINALLDKERDLCSSCRERIGQREELCCGHCLCKACYREITKKKPVCPDCGTVYAPIVGDQPKNGKMCVTMEHKLKLPGYETANGTIVINYTIPDGIQESCHPNPGKRYHGTCRTAYLPNNRDGNEVLKLLQKAFESRLTFTVGQSQTTGRKNVVIWTDINHKTSPCGGPANCGFPDASYLSLVRQQLEKKGIK
eukprot:XP_014782569.1 PREDICTED: uncharacterized protein LOC106878006 isoform X1 [Octopus bimaculoides]